MKKLFVLLVALIGLGTTVANAQIARGVALIGGQGSLRISSVGSTDSTDATTGVNFIISPNIGYFVVDNLAMGLALDISLTSGENLLGDSETNVSYSFGPYIRKYFNYRDTVYPFAEISFGIGGNSAGGKTNSQIGIGVGAAFFVSDNVSIDPKLSFKLGVDDPLTTDFGVDVGLQVYLGR